uniref:receptor protein serine/threonine kinase n=1 Tax=Gasterosteus aculeatus aculeatus TaxID=481459 RepID=A0AAQ4PS42_GASAC|nr:anti-Muellerian hormone type-2 receptor-like [Gasterosteus aculeatus aculeatus]
MILQRWWLIGAVACIFTCSSDQSLLQKRQCTFQVGPRNQQYKTTGNVSGSVQLCENTQCCVAYYVIINDQPKLDVLACDLVEKSCPDAICRGQTRFDGRLLWCTCKTDFCNSNITLIPELEAPQPPYFNIKDQIMKAGALIVPLLFLCFLLVIAVKCRHLFKKRVPRDCSSQATETSEIDIADIELQQILGHGYFATVWQGKYKGSVVAVKVFPASRKHKFTAEKEVYELPLMNHAGIVPFLGSGSKPDGGGWLIVLQFVESGSLHSYLCKHSPNWMLTLKLCQSLSQGLAYLHSDLHKPDGHKPPVAHRDLTSSNVLVTADGTCVLCDFGCSTIVPCCPGNRSSRSQTTIMEGPAQVGTLPYMPPEILEGTVDLNSSWCLIQADIYALALLLWEILMRCSDLFEGGVAPQHLLPYESELGVVTLDSLIQFVCHMDERPAVPRHWELLPQGPVLQELLTDCWDCEADARLSAACVMERLAALQTL